MRQLGDVRALEQAAAEATSAMLEGWVPEVSALSGAPARRAGYWREVVAPWVRDRDPGGANHLLRLARTLTQAGYAGQAGLTFYPPPRVLRADGDPVAARWGLTQGVRPLELRQAVERLRRLYG